MTVTPTDITPETETETPTLSEDIGLIRRILDQNLTTEQSEFVGELLAGLSYRIVCGLKQVQDASAVELTDEEAGDAFLAGISDLWNTATIIESLIALIHPAIGAPELVTAFTKAQGETPPVLDALLSEAQQSDVA